MARSDEVSVATLVHERPTLDALDDAGFRLVVVEGPDAGLHIDLDAGTPTRILVGQGSACALRLTDPAASRRHVALEYMGSALRVTDLGSTNGTFVDRVRVVEAELSGDELLRIGSTVLRVDRLATAGAAPPPAEAFGRLLGASAAMRRLYPLCERIALSSVPAVIEGETGTGKEVLAVALHERGPRADGPFVVFDCTAVPANLLEAELFGHERGAFTGAIGSRKGVFEQAHGGTLLIDEIGELDAALQPKLLRALERSEVRRIGGDRWLRVDVRVLAATRRDLDREVQAGRFRDDLFHRLAVARIELPPLRHRDGDVELLADRLWVAMGGRRDAIPAAVMQRWLEYPWPGNVRELRNAVARQLALGDLAGAPVAAEAPRGDASAGDAEADPMERLLASGLSYTEARDRLLLEFERRFVARLLERHAGDVARAAAASGIGLRYFQKLRARSK